MAEKHSKLAQQEDTKTSSETPPEASSASDLDEVQTLEGSDAPASEPTATPVTPTIHRNWLQRFGHGYMHHKKWSIPLSILALIGIVLAIPATRYPVLGLGMTQDYMVMVADSSTHAPVTGATVTLDGKKVTTNNKGEATVRGHVGAKTAQVSKRYYTSASAKVFIGVRTTHNMHTVQIIATGRQVPITVINAITKKPLENASVSAKGATVKTDKQGKATIVLPAISAMQPATITASGYNQAKATITATGNTVMGNIFAITPVGKAYFLSNANGTIDVVSANLDGSARKVLLTGTGKENPSNVRMTQSDDGQYVALISGRDGGEYDKLFLIETSSGKLTTVDEGTASFSMVGWSGHSLVYMVYRDKMKYWQANTTALKSYNADSKKLAVLDQNDGMGTELNYAYQVLENIHIVDGAIVLDTAWYGSPTMLAGKSLQIVKMNVDGSGKKVLKEVALQSNNPYVKSYIAKPQELYFSLEQYDYQNNSRQNTYFRYANGTVSTVADAAAQSVINQPQLTYISSPSGNKTFWSESRDGAYALFVGDQNAGNPQQIATQSEYQAYGWSSDNYVLVFKKNELYAMSVAGGNAVKISAYYTPAPMGH